MRRTTTPTTSKSTTATIRPAPPARSRALTSPAVNAGVMTSRVTRPMAHAVPAVMTPYSALPTTATANMPGARRMPCPSTNSPRRKVYGWSLTRSLSLVGK